jgi:hypothetical protein
MVLDNSEAVVAHTPSSPVSSRLGLHRCALGSLSSAIVRAVVAGVARSPKATNRAFGLSGQGDLGSKMLNVDLRPDAGAVTFDPLAGF